jgi:hypothetical protein
MDEAKRDIYNRFSEKHLKFDPRQDELKLLSNMSATYIFWLIVSYISTYPKSCKASFSWIVIFLIAMLVLEVFLTLTESNIGSLGLTYMTEYELVYYLHIFFPFIVSVLRIVAEYLYLDLDTRTIDALSVLSNHQKV